MPAADESTEALYRDIGQRVRRAREAAGLRQDQLAHRVGMARTSITNIEAGRQHIQIHVLFALADALSVSPDAFLPVPRSQPERPLLREEEARDLGPDERDWVERVLTQER